MPIRLPSLPLLALACCLIFPAAALHAQDNQPARVQFADQPYRIDSVGLSIDLPIDTRVSSSVIGTTTSAQVQALDNSWILNIQTPETSNPDATVAEAAAKTWQLIQGAHGIVSPDQKTVVRTHAKLLAEQPNLTINNHPAHRLYVSVPNTDGSRIIQAYTFFKPLPNQYVVFEMITTQAEFERLKPLYETVVATATFTDPNLIQQARLDAITASKSFLALLSPEDYDAVFDNTQQWFRCYKPSKSGASSDDTEIYYLGLRAWKGQQGEINPSRPQSRYTADERTEGYLVSVKIRYLIDDPTSPVAYADSQGYFFMSPDRHTEAWNLSTALKDDSDETLSTTTEIGGRFDRKLEIQIAEPGQPGRVIRPYMETTDAYICQPERYMLPQLLIRAATTDDFAFYAYHSTRESVGLRYESLTHPPEAPTAWQLVSLESKDAKPKAAVYSQDGRLIRSLDKASGAVITPTTLKALLNIWQKKDLPTS